MQRLMSRSLLRFAFLAGSWVIVQALEHGFIDCLFRVQPLLDWCQHSHKGCQHSHTESSLGSMLADLIDLLNAWTMYRPVLRLSHKAVKKVLRRNLVNNLKKEGLLWDAWVRFRDIVNERSQAKAHFIEVRHEDWCDNTPNSDYSNVPDVKNPTTAPALASVPLGKMATGKPVKLDRKPSKIAHQSAQPRESEEINNHVNEFLKACQLSTVRSDSIVFQVDYVTVPRKVTITTADKITGHSDWEGIIKEGRRNGGRVIDLTVQDKGEPMQMCGLIAAGIVVTIKIGEDSASAGTDISLQDLSLTIMDKQRTRPTETKVTKLTLRFRDIHAFGSSGIRCFAEKVADMKQIAARDYLNMILPAVPLHILEAVTRDMAAALRRFASKWCPQFSTNETPRARTFGELERDDFGAVAHAWGCSEHTDVEIPVVVCQSSPRDEEAQEVPAFISAVMTGLLVQFLRMEGMKTSSKNGKPEETHRARAYSSLPDNIDALALPDNMSSTKYMSSTNDNVSAVELYYDRAIPRAVWGRWKGVRNTSKGGVALRDAAGQYEVDFDGRARIFALMHLTIRVYGADGFAIGCVEWAGLERERSKRWVYDENTVNGYRWACWDVDEDLRQAKHFFIRSSYQKDYILDQIDFHSLNSFRQGKIRELQHAALSLVMDSDMEVYIAFRLCYTIY
ncbi:hypothetical protein BDZ89DRAFT_1043625 [Hymenopellis radicata]|nr:hypothetical protein BDZ89DRAFT_1043625 [Hymenopellis radicata]